MVETDQVTQIKFYHTFDPLFSQVSLHFELNEAFSCFCTLYATVFTGNIKPGRGDYWSGQGNVVPKKKDIVKALYLGF